jgi:hypothetical protein
MTVSIVRGLVIELATILLSVVLIRRGVANLKRARELRNLPLLSDEQLGAVEQVVGLEWQTGVSERWPTGTNKHRSQLETENGRRAYAALARRRSSRRSVVSEIALLVAAALLSFTLPMSLSHVAHLHPKTVANSGLGQFFPEYGGYQEIAGIWPSVILLLGCYLSIELRRSASRLRTLADLYDAYRPSLRGSASFETPPVAVTERASNLDAVLVGVSAVIVVVAPLSIGHAVARKVAETLRLFWGSKRS